MPHWPGEETHGFLSRIANAVTAGLCRSEMRIDATELIGPYSGLLVRTTLRYLRPQPWWGLAKLKTAGALPPGDERAQRVTRASTEKAPEATPVPTS